MIELVQTLILLFILGGGLLILAEAIIPGAHFIVLGVALFSTGITAMALPSSWVNLLTLILLPGIYGAIAFLLFRHLDIYSSDEEQTTTSDSLVGIEGEVKQRVTQSQGRVELDKTGFEPSYGARSTDGVIPVGTRVVVTDGRGGNIVTVEPVTE